MDPYGHLGLYEPINDNTIVRSKTMQDLTPEDKIRIAKDIKTGRETVRKIDKKYFKEHGVPYKSPHWKIPDFEPDAYEKMTEEEKDKLINVWPDGWQKEVEKAKKADLKNAKKKVKEKVTPSDL